MPAPEWHSHQTQRLGGNRLRLSQGPIDLVICAWGPSQEVQGAYVQAERAFKGLLSELVKDLTSLRTPIATKKPEVHHPIAKKMVQAVWPHRATYVTSMASVAGAVADYILQALMAERKLEKAFVNNGGDIACHVSGQQQLTIALADPFIGPIGSVLLTSKMPSRGIATSGWRGRSFSLGIADTVTVLAKSAAQADVAATLIANAVLTDHHQIERQPANEIDIDSDLGDLPITVDVGSLDQDAINAALSNGKLVALSMLDQGLIHAAGLSLQGSFRGVGGIQALSDQRPVVTSSNTSRNFG